MFKYNIFYSMHRETCTKDLCLTIYEIYLSCSLVGLHVPPVHNCCTRLMQALCLASLQWIEDWIPSKRSGYDGKEKIANLLRMKWASRVQKHPMIFQIFQVIDLLWNKRSLFQAWILCCSLQWCGAVWCYLQYRN